MLSNNRRKEIATFLRTRRARLRPEQVGLSRGARRRTPGLRREEVAALAGLSIEWYTWLEQARDVRASKDALRRIAAALRLEPDELQHLLTLSGHTLDDNGNGSANEASLINPPLQRLIDQLVHCPAWVTGERWDFLAWNRAATVIHGDLEKMGGIERNGLYQLFLNPRMRGMLVDWELHARDCVAKLRLTHAHYVDDPWFNEVIDLLRTRSPEFAAWWNDHNVQLPHDGVKAYEHPQAGRLTFDYTVLKVPGDRVATLQLVTYVPSPATDTREKIEELLKTAPQSGRHQTDLQAAPESAAG